MGGLGTRDSGAVAEGFGGRGLIAPWGALRAPKNMISHPKTSVEAWKNEFSTLFEENSRARSTKHYCKLRPIRSHASPSEQPHQSSPSQASVKPQPSPSQTVAGLGLAPTSQSSPCQAPAQPQHSQLSPRPAPV